MWHSPVLCASWTTRRGCMHGLSLERFEWEIWEQPGGANKTLVHQGSWASVAMQGPIWATHGCSCQMWSQLSHTHSSITLRWYFQWSAWFRNSSAVLDKQKEQVSLSLFRMIPARVGTALLLYVVWGRASKQNCSLPSWQQIALLGLLWNWRGPLFLRQ